MPSEATVLASSNPGKLREFRQMLNGAGITLQAQDELGVPPVEESGLSFVENALIKARNAARHTGRAALADDSGIAVDALNGAPGIHSARYAGATASDAENLRQLIQAMDAVPTARRSAQFICALVFVRHATDPVPLISQGVWHGRLLEQPRGSGGFGYDPIFYLPELGRTSAELSAEHKNRLSHRGQALAEMRQLLQRARVSQHAAD